MMTAFDEWKCPIVVPKLVLEFTFRQCRSSDLETFVHFICISLCEVLLSLYHRLDNKIKFILLYQITS